MIDLLDSYARKGWRGFLIPRATSARDQRLPVRMRARVHLISMAPTGRARGGSTHYASPSSLTCAALAEAAPLETRRLHERREERRPTKQKHYARCRRSFCSVPPLLGLRVSKGRSTWATMIGVGSAMISGMGRATVASAVSAGSTAIGRVVATSAINACSTTISGVGRMAAASPLGVANDL
ncbi:hypothetical protein B296_00019913 [Ensete ventricosum]|uniref:Uncharacterized protein n=1 Tax=Ensete ventricosum TaxID=4639 RepID=A0A426Y7N6_ENSVE|nr:hypothetical protein B296_00019913 [Ensete ventricosum]